MLVVTLFTQQYYSMTRGVNMDFKDVGFLTSQMWIIGSLLMDNIVIKIFMLLFAVFIFFSSRW